MFLNCVCLYRDFKFMYDMKIVIDFGDVENIEENEMAYALKSVSEHIEQGYTSGIIGCGTADWWIEKED